VNWKRSIGAVAILVGAFIAWGWWRRRGTAPAAAPAVPSGQLSIGQVGASIREDSTPELVKLFANFTTGVINNTLCWRRTYRDFDGSNAGSEVWTHTDGRTFAVPPGSPPPSPRCDGY
jgi:hypothetical protein